MNSPSSGTFFNIAVQRLFREGTERIDRELPFGELALSSLDIAQRAGDLRRKPSPAQAVIAIPETARAEDELPIGELALSDLDIARRARRFGMAGTRHSR